MIFSKLTILSTVGAVVIGFGSGVYFQGLRDDRANYNRYQHEVTLMQEAYIKRDAKLAESNKHALTLEQKLTNIRRQVRDINNEKNRDNSNDTSDMCVVNTDSVFKLNAIIDATNYD